MLNQFMASTKESSAKSQLLNLEACVLWIKRLLITNSGLWTSWPISFFYDFFVVVFYPAWSIWCWIVITQIYCWICCSSIIICKKMQYIPKRLLVEFFPSNFHEYNFQDIFMQLSREEEILSKILWQQVFKLNSLLRYLKIFLMLLSTWMCRKPLYFSAVTSSPWSQNFSTFLSPFLTLLNTHTDFMNLFISLLLAQLPFIKELSVLSQELLLQFSFIFQSASILECQVRTFHFFVFSPFSWQNLKHEGPFAQHIFYLSRWL